MLRNLKAEMARRGVSTSDLMGVTRKSYNNIRGKIRGTSSFLLKDAVAIRDEFFPELAIEYLFENADGEKR